MMPVVVKNEGAREFAVRGLNGWAVDDLSTVVSPVPSCSTSPFFVPAALDTTSPYISSALLSSPQLRSCSPHHAQASEAADALREEGNFIIVSKPLAPAAPASGAASSPAKPAPAPADLSAASTPERTKLAEETTTAPDPSREAASQAASSVPAFDPTFGQVALPAASPSPPCCPAAAAAPPRGPLTCAFLFGRRRRRRSGPTGARRRRRCCASSSRPASYRRDWGGRPRSAPPRARCPARPGMQRRAERGCPIAALAHAPARSSRPPRRPARFKHLLSWHARGTLVARTCVRALPTCMRARGICPRACSGRACSVPWVVVTIPLPARTARISHGLARLGRVTSNPRATSDAGAWAGFQGNLPKHSLETGFSRAWRGPRAGADAEAGPRADAGFRGGPGRAR
jgi:hypothetical protein